MSQPNTTWLELGKRLLAATDLVKPLTEASVNFMTGCVDQLEETGTLSARQTESYIRNINIYTGTKYPQVQTPIGPANQGPRSIAVVLSQDVPTVSGATYRKRDAEFEELSAKTTQLEVDVAVLKGQVELLKAILSDASQRRRELR